MAKKLKKLVLKKRTWLRGETAYASGLRIGNKMCCLGFLARSCGVKVCDMKGKAMPHNLERKDYEKMPMGFKSLYSTMADINDREALSDEKRVRKLRPHFKTLGYRLVVL